MMGKSVNLYLMFGGKFCLHTPSSSETEQVFNVYRIQHTHTPCRYIPVYTTCIEIKIYILYVYITEGCLDVPKQCCPYECSGTPGLQINRPLWHNVPWLIHPCHFVLYNTFRLMKNDWDVSMQGHCVSGTIHLGDQGSQNICTGQGTHRFGTFRHPTYIFVWSD